MDKRIALKWAQALRSGRYAKTTGCLRDKKGFCCLGVLCELYREETNDGEWRGTGSFVAMSFVAMSPSLGVLPPAVRTWAGMRSSLGVFDPLKAFDLTDLNDGRVGEFPPQPFSVIADVIEMVQEDL